MTRVVGMGILSLAIAGCGTSSSVSKDNKKKENKDGMQGISTVEKTSLKLYSAGEKTNDGMRVENSDGTYTYGAANVDSSKLRKVDDESYTRGIGGNDQLVCYYWTLDGSDDYNNGIEFACQEGDDQKNLISADIRFSIDDQSLQLYKDKGILPANATKKTARKMVEAEFDYIAKLLKDDNISKNGYDLKNKNEMEQYELERDGYFAKFIDDEPFKMEKGNPFCLYSYTEDFTEVHLSKFNSNGDFDGAIKFIFIDSIYMNRKSNQILMKRYGLDSLLDRSISENLYTFNESKLTTGIFGQLMKLYKKDSQEWDYPFSENYAYREYDKEYKENTTSSK